MIFSGPNQIQPLPKIHNEFSAFAKYKMREQLGIK